LTPHVSKVAQRDSDEFGSNAHLRFAGRNAMETPVDGVVGATRKDLQLGRRLIHVANGVAIATAYGLLFEHRQVVYIFGTIACVVYILDRVRIHYPELVRKAPWIHDVFFRTEEQVRESAMVPYAISILLTLITFPKPAAMIAIYTLAIADPLSAMVGITWGRRHVVPDKTVEGSAAFFVAAFACSAVVLHATSDAPMTRIAGAAFGISLVAAAFEMLPLRIDDNLTIPLFVGFVTWIVCGLVGVPLT
jgi:dolichol kinase